VRCGQSLPGADHLAPWRLDAAHIARDTPGNLDHPFAEIARHTDQDWIAGLDKVKKRGFDPCAAGAGQGQGQPVLGLKHLAQQSLRLVHDRKELGVHVADNRRRHRPQHPRVHNARTRAKQESGGTDQVGRV
jgi:hypothetical protein